jgi:hypothetical protein
MLTGRVTPREASVHGRSRDLMTRHRVHEHQMGHTHHLCSACDENTLLEERSNACA